ncbi:MAG TPA: HXXEE domain-containing protein [Pyrinomonadaceae bacterium]|jgi:hypothetical protein
MVIANVLTFAFSGTGLWPWLFPVTYLVHIAEEYWGGAGFSAHAAQERGINFPPRRFLLLTGLGGLLMIAGITLAQSLKFPQLLLVIFGTVVLINSLSHSLSSLRKGKYNPGLISAVLLWLPLGAITLFSLRSGMTGQRYACAVAIGISIHAVVSWLALRGERVA